jgi:hypothetical protein
VSLPNSDGGNDLAQPGIQAQVWLPSNPMLTSTLAYGASDPSNPAAGWTAWSPFSFPGEVPDSAIVVQTANDGSGRAYVWVNVDPSDESDLDNLGTDDSYWYYSYSMGGGEFWSPLIPFPVPEPSALTLDSNFPVGVAGPVCLNVIGAAPLPSGALQVFYLGVSGQVYTCIQNQPADASTPGTFPAMEPFNPPYFEALILEAIRNGAIFRDIAGLRLPWIP